MPTTMSRRVTSFAAALLLLAASAAQAQYAWIDANGTRQYSDRPPPPGTPASKILKSPRGTVDLSESESAVQTVTDMPGDAKGPSTLAQREAAYRDRVKAREEKNLQDQVAAHNKRAEEQRCANAREVKAQLASGLRIAQVGPNGEQTYMSDEEKANRNARANEALRTCQ